jgi:uncharacterized YccA/Bax inhibitor family protein
MGILSVLRRQRLSAGALTLLRFFDAHDRLNRHSSISAMAWNTAVTLTALVGTGNGNWRYQYEILMRI